jgi:hypothetical protein
MVKWTARESASAQRLYRMATKGIVKWTPGYIQEREEDERQTAAVG